jgi:hypothetical protein
MIAELVRGTGSVQTVERGFRSASSEHLVVAGSQGTDCLDVN